MLKFHWNILILIVLIGLRNEAVAGVVLVSIKYMEIQGHSWKQEKFFFLSITESWLKKYTYFFFELWYSLSKNLDFLDKSSKWTKHSEMDQLKFVEDSL